MDNQKLTCQEYEREIVDAKAYSGGTDDYPPYRRTMTWQKPDGSLIVGEVFLRGDGSVNSGVKCRHYRTEEEKE